MKKKFYKVIALTLTLFIFYFNVSAYAWISIDHDDIYVYDGTTYRFDDGMTFDKAKVSELIFLVGVLKGVSLSFSDSLTIDGLPVLKIKNGTFDGSYIINTANYALGNHQVTATAKWNSWPDLAYNSWSGTKNFFLTDSSSTPPAAQAPAPPAVNNQAQKNALNKQIKNLKKKVANLNKQIKNLKKKLKKAAAKQKKALKKKMSKLNKQIKSSKKKVASLKKQIKGLK